jgi:prepilin-type N-terminal cleavage/methylation domain-containing protein
MKTRGSTSRRAFTLTELLVVITLLVIVVAVGLPAFGSMLSSSNRTLAVGQFRAAMAAARDAAIGSTDSDAAAVFFFEPGGRMSIVPCVQVGTIADRDPANPGSYPTTSIRRDVFAPSGTSETIQLPAGWSVRAFAGSAELDANNNATGWYPDLNERYYDRQAGSWVFPETGFYDLNADRDEVSGNQGRTLRQTFMVRFERGTGNLVVNQSVPAIVVAGRPSAVGNLTRASNGAARDINWKRIDRAENVASWAKRLLSRRVLTSGASGNGMVSANDLAVLIGAESGDTVLAGTSDLIALYDERVMAAGIGARGLNRFSGSLYRWGVLNDAANQPPNRPEIDTALFTNGSASQVAERVDRWIVGTLQLDGREVESDAIIYGFDRYTGRPREVKP